MAAYESGEKPPLQGVSQQVARERLPGQCTAQENMLADPVTNLRRRPGAEYKFNLPMPGADASKVVGWYVDVAGFNVHVLLNLSDGTIKLLDEGYTVLATLAGGAYCTSTVRKNIQAAVVGDELFILNKAIKPTEVAAVGVVDPTRQGMFYINAGAFNQRYEISVTTSTGTISASYTTPNGTGVNDANLSSPAYIAGQLRTQLEAAKATAGLNATYVTDAYVYVLANVGVTGTKVTSSTGTIWITPSRDSYLTSESQLPARLPSAADGYIIKVGDVKLPKYYKYVEASQSWLESGSFDAPASLSNMPISIQYSGGTWSINTAAYEGRLAGDTGSNPTPRFVTFGVTGIGSYQGRLALLSGAQVVLSASNKPRRFYRSTVVSLLDSDPIQIGSSANSSAAYEYAVPFQKDLLLFSSKYQALIPSSNVAVTPRTATVIVTSTYGADMSCSPVPLGRTVMYPAPRSADFFGMQEMIPSTSADSQYVSFDVTPHLPKYMGGRCRFGVSSTTANMAVFSPTGDVQSLIVHEYQWEGEQKTQQAWHRWSFAYDIAFVYFAGDTMHVGFIQNETLVVCTIDPRIGGVNVDAERRPFLDLYFPETIVDHSIPLPAWFTTFDPDAAARAVVRSGSLVGALVGTTPGVGELTTVLSFPTGEVFVGVPFTSTFSPSPPMHRDRNGAVVSTGKTTLQRYIISTVNSTNYSVSVQDSDMDVPEVYEAATLYWSSTELELDSAWEGGESIAVVPCRTHADSTSIILSTSEVGEMNIIALDHVLKHTSKFTRRTI